MMDFMQKKMVWAVLGLAFWGTAPGLASGVFAQTRTAEDIKRYRYYPPFDTVLRKREIRNAWRERIRPTERFDFIFNRGFLLRESGTEATSTSGSGQYFLGLSFNYFLTRRVVVKVQPGVSVLRFLYTDSLEKPPIRAQDKLQRIRLGADYLQASFGAGFVIYRDTVKKRVVSMAEGGMSVGYKIGETKSYEIQQDPNSTATSSLNVPDGGPVLPFQLGVYARLTYRFVGVWAFYRLANFFPPNVLQSDGRNYPRFSRLEIGFSLVL